MTKLQDSSIITIEGSSNSSSPAMPSLSSRSDRGRNDGSVVSSLPSATLTMTLVSTTARSG